MNKIALFLHFVLSSFTILGQSQNHTLRVGYTAAPPFIVENGETLEGINVWLWERNAKDLELEYELIPMDFNELLKGLEEGSVDLSINPLTITSERSKKMEFTDSFYASNSTIAVAEVSSIQKFISFVKGFFSINFLKGLLVLLFIILLFGSMVWFFERKSNKEQFRSSPRGIWDGLWWSAVTLTTVGYGDKAPQSKMGRAVALLLMFVGLLFISGLTASIASSLTVDQLNSNPVSFNEFKAHTVGSIGNSGSNEFLRSHFFKDIRLYDGVVSGLNDLRNNELQAFIYDEPILKYRIRQDSMLQKLTILPVKFNVQFYAFGLAKGNIELEQALSQKILEVIEGQGWEIILNEYGLTEI